MIRQMGWPAICREPVLRASKSVSIYIRTRSCILPSVILAVTCARNERRLWAIRHMLQENCHIESC